MSLKYGDTAAEGRAVPACAQCHGGLAEGFQMQTAAVGFRFQCLLRFRETKLRIGEDLLDSASALLQRWKCAGAANPLLVDSGSPRRVHLVDVVPAIVVHADGDRSGFRCH